MAAPLTKTGFRQASNELRHHGLRPCRTQNAPNLADSSFKFAAVPLKRGLTDQTVKPEDVYVYADTLTELVRLVASKKAEEVAGQTAASQEQGQFPRAGTSYVDYETPKDLPVELTPEQTAAIKVLTESGKANRAEIEKVVEEVAGRAIDASRDSLIAQWTVAVNESEKRLEQAANTVHARVQEAIDSVKTTRVEVVKPDHEPIVIEGAHEAFPILIRELGLGNSCFLKGPAGSGKTTAVIQAAEALNIPYFLMRAVLDPFELLGFIDAGGTYRDTPLFQWAKTPGALLIMDEVDRSNPKAVIALNTAWNGQIPFPSELVKVDPSNLIVATANTFGLGADAEYVGSCRLDAATLNRFPTRIDWGYDKALEARISGNPEEAAWCQRLRAAAEGRGIRIVFGPRDVVAHCKRVAAGVSRFESMVVSVLATVEANTRDLLMTEADK